MRRWLLGVLLAFAAIVPEARAEVVWLCEPGMADDPCEIELDTTVRTQDGSETVVTPKRAPQAKRPVDCFYVYPTVSNQPTPAATKARDPELESIAKYQAARFSSVCRMYAPIYRQGTLLGLAAGVATGSSDPNVRRTAYADVEEAWLEYLRERSRGRGFVLIGHSQGTRMLRALIAKQIDPRPALRKRLVGAVLLGGNVTVAEGRRRGGDFQQIPICTRRGQFGCVVAFSSYSNDPPDESRYGEATEGDPVLGLPGGEGYEVACTDPGPLSGLTKPFGITVPSEPFAPGIINATIVGTAGAPPSAETTWVTPPDRYEGSCKTIGGANVLRYEPLGKSRRPRHQPSDDWGTHVIDMNLGYARQVRIVAIQIRRWLARQAARRSMSSIR